MFWDARDENTENVDRKNLKVVVKCALTAGNVIKAIVFLWGIKRFFLPFSLSVIKVQVPTPHSFNLSVSFSLITTAHTHSFSFCFYFYNIFI